MEPVVHLASTAVSDVTATVIASLVSALPRAASSSSLLGLQLSADAVMGSCVAMEKERVMGSCTAAPVLVGNLQELPYPHPRRDVDALHIAELQVVAGRVVVVAQHPTPSLSPFPRARASLPASCRRRPAAVCWLARARAAGSTGSTLGRARFCPLLDSATLHLIHVSYR